MKLLDIIQLPREEQENIVNGIYDTMTSMGIDELLARMRALISAAVSEREDNGINWKETLLTNGNYTVSFEGNKIHEIRMYANNYDSMEAVLSAAGFCVTFDPEHGNYESLLKVDDFENFLKMTENL